MKKLEVTFAGQRNIRGSGNLFDVVKNLVDWRKVTDMELPVVRMDLAEQFATVSEDPRSRIAATAKTESCSRVEGPPFPDPSVTVEEKIDVVVEEAVCKTSFASVSFDLDTIIAL